MRSAGLADTPRLLAVLQRFENDILALGLDPVRIETGPATARVLLRHLRDELWPIELRDMTQADGSSSIGRLSIGISADVHAAPEPA